jgi:hypothetical protein
MIRSEIRTIAYLGVAIPVGVTTIVSAILANMRFRHELRLPIQCWLDGKVTWSAPRAVALAFIPVLATGVLGLWRSCRRRFRRAPGRRRLCGR